MNPDDPRWREWPVLRELHDQWWSSRGGRIGGSQRPYSRDWETLLEDSGLVSAEARAEAERDVRQLAAAGLVVLRPPKHRPHLIERVLVPVEAELRLARLFGDPLVDPLDRPDSAGMDWEPELAFVRDGRTTLPLEDLRAINGFLAGGGRQRPLVPIKERSLQLFGDEKRLDALLATAPFRDGRISPETLRCSFVAEPLGWRRGPKSEGPVLVIENLATWDSYVRWNEQAAAFSGVVYGKGLVFADAVIRLTDIFQEIGGVRRVEYFGDLDPPGLEIPWRASRRAQAAGLPNVEPHLASYRRLLEAGAGREAAWEGDPAGAEAIQWLGELAGPVRELFARHQRLAQEHVGWELLSGLP
jgi:hypothetical protein